jgi:hypothetical protein
MRDTTGLTEALSEPEVYPFFAVELMFDTRTVDFGGVVIESGPLYFWTGLGDLTIGDITYTGTGNMLQISEVKKPLILPLLGLHLL